MFDCFGVGEIANNALIANINIGVKIPKLMNKADNNGVVK